MARIQSQEFMAAGWRPALAVVVLAKLQGKEETLSFVLHHFKFRNSLNI